MNLNLRHLRAFLAIVDTGSITQAASRVGVSQPAVTLAMRKLEMTIGVDLLQRSPKGVFPTPAGHVFALRITRALGPLDDALRALSPRLVLTASFAQLNALIATCAAQNFTLAAKRMQRAQPTLHRAVSQLEKEAGRKLFERSAHGITATRPAQLLAQMAQLAFAELDQAETDLAELAGREVGRIVIGAMPLSRSYLLPRAISVFRKQRAVIGVRALDGPYDDLMSGLRRGEVDFLIGALRVPAPIGDIVQERLFDDHLVFVARPDHPIFQRETCTLKQVLRHPMVVATRGTPARNGFDMICAQDGVPVSLVETGSMVLMRELLRHSDHLGCISRLQIEAEIASGTLRIIPIDLPSTARPIGLTYRREWMPTQAHVAFLDALRGVVAMMPQSPPLARLPA